MKGSVHKIHTQISEIFYLPFVLQEPYKLLWLETERGHERGQGVTIAKGKLGN
jgi:hypothetical protein